MPRFKHQKSRKRAFVSTARYQEWWSELDLAMLGAACGAEIDDTLKKKYYEYQWPTRRLSPQRIQTMFPKRTWAAIKFQCTKYGWLPGAAPNGKGG